MSDYQICHVSKQRWVIFLNGEPKSKAFESPTIARMLRDWWNLPADMHDHISPTYRDAMKLIEAEYELE